MKRTNGNKAEDIQAQLTQLIIGKATVEKATSEADFIAFIEASDINYTKILHETALNGSARMLSVLFDKFKTKDIPDSTGYTAIHHAIANSNIECMEYLIDHKNASGTVIGGWYDHNGYTLMHVAAAWQSRGSKMANGKRI